MDDPETPTNEPERLRLDLARREERVKARETELDVRSRWDEDLRVTAANLDAGLLHRDRELLRRDKEIAHRDREIAELRRIQQALLEELDWRRKNEESLRETEERLVEDIEHLRSHVAAVEKTRLWRVGQRYRSVKAALRRGARGGPG
jgi:hypothetical protein